MYVWLVAWNGILSLWQHHKQSHRRRRLHHHRDVRRLQHRPPFPQQNRRSGASHQQPSGPGEGGGTVRNAEVRGALRLAHDVGNDAHVPGEDHSFTFSLLIGLQLALN